jgi:DNA (cytosine-5)-methyltransferase 1
MRIGSLFSGIGGFDLGLTRAGHDIIWQVEIDEWCRKVLEKHWPDAVRFSDIRDCGLHNLEHVEIICGGFPCQNLSTAGDKEGVDGEKSSLWWEMLRVISELRPRYVIVENVPGLLIRGFDEVLGSLAEVGYDAEWDVVSAADVGAPHLRERIWIVAYPNHMRELPKGNKGYFGRWTGDCGEKSDLAHADSTGLQKQCGTKPVVQEYRLSQRCSSEEEWQNSRNSHWETEPNVGRVAHGIPNRIHRLRGLGNAIVPQIAHEIGLRLT